MRGRGDLSANFGIEVVFLDGSVEILDVESNTIHGIDTAPLVGIIKHLFQCLSFSRLCIRYTHCRGHYS